MSGNIVCPNNQKITDIMGYTDSSNNIVNLYVKCNDGTIKRASGDTSTGPAANQTSFDLKACGDGFNIIGMQDKTLVADCVGEFTSNTAGGIGPVTFDVTKAYTYFRCPAEHVLAGIQTQLQSGSIVLKEPFYCIDKNGAYTSGNFTVPTSGDTTAPTPQEDYSILWWIIGAAIVLILFAVCGVITMSFIK